MRRDFGAPPAGDSDLRCLCGGLMARWTNGTLELKCRRCKRTVAIPCERIEGLDALLRRQNRERGGSE